MNQIPLITALSLPPSLLAPARLVGLTPVLSIPQDPRCSYSMYIPSSSYIPVPGSPPPSLPILVLLHGTTRSIGPLLSAFIPLADSLGLALLAPIFPAGLHGPNDWDSFREVRSANSSFPSTNTQPENGNGNENKNTSAPTHPLHVDTTLSTILTSISARWPGLRTSRPLLVGFSAGASAAQRLALISPERCEAVCLAAPGSLTALNAGDNWPLGLRDFEKVFGYPPPDLLQVGRWKLLVGDEDTALEGSLSGIQGVVRDWERREGKTWLEGEREGVDWVEMVRGSMSLGRREVLEVFAGELRARGRDVGVEVVLGGRHDLGDLAPRMEAFVREVVEGMRGGAGSCG